jgi:hypothetical protein
VQAEGDPSPSLARLRFFLSMFSIFSLVLKDRSLSDGSGPLPWIDGGTYMLHEGATNSLVSQGSLAVDAE